MDHKQAAAHPDVFLQLGRADLGDARLKPQRGVRRDHVVALAADNQPVFRDALRREDVLRRLDDVERKAAVRARGKPFFDDLGRCQRSSQITNTFSITPSTFCFRFSRTGVVIIIQQKAPKEQGENYVFAVFFTGMRADAASPLFRAALSHTAKAAQAVQTARPLR